MILFTSLVSGQYFHKYVIPLRDMDVGSELFGEIFCCMVLISGRKALTLATCFNSKLISKPVYSINNKDSNSSNKKHCYANWFTQKNGLVSIT